MGVWRPDVDLGKGRQHEVILKGVALSTAAWEGDVTITDSWWSPEPSSGESGHKLPDRGEGCPHQDNVQWRFSVSLFQVYFHLLNLSSQVLYCLHWENWGLGAKWYSLRAFAESYLGVGALSSHSDMGYSCKFIENPLVESFV